MRKLNQGLVDKLRKGEMAIYYGSKGIGGDFEGLTLVLKEAFKNYSGSLGGNSNYYKKMIDNDDWIGFEVLLSMPTVKLEEFFITVPEVIDNYEIF